MQKPAEKIKSLTYKPKEDITKEDNWNIVYKKLYNCE